MPSEFTKDHYVWVTTRFRHLMVTKRSVIEEDIFQLTYATDAGVDADI
jgi:hypothetical protein